MSAPIGVGLVGYGLAGKVFHGMLIRRTPELEVRAVVTGNAVRRDEAARDFPAATVYDRFDRLLEDDRVQLAVVGTPHDTHARLAIRALERGKHVVVDKIMALGTAEADAMIDAARRAGVLLSVFQNRRWDSDYLTVRKAIADGALGEVYVVESSVTRYRPAPDSGRPLPWRMQARSGGGPFRDWGAHLVDQAVQLFGAQDLALYADFQYRWPGIDVETAATCEIRYDRGVRFRIEVGHISHIPRPRWYVRGSKGALMIEGLDPQEEAMKQGDVVSGTARAKMPEAACRLVSDVPGAALTIVPGEYLAYYRNIARAIAGEEPLAVTPESARDALRVIEAAVRSATRGEVTRL